MNIVLILVFVRRTAMTLNWTRLFNYGLSQPMPNFPMSLLYGTFFAGHFLPIKSLSVLEFCG